MGVPGSMPAASFNSHGLQPEPPREATHKELLIAWWFSLPLTWAFAYVFIIETMTLPLAVILRSLEILPPLFTTYPGSDWTYGSRGYMTVNKKGEPVAWYLLYLVHHPLTFIAASMVSERVRYATYPVLQQLLVPRLAATRRGRILLSLISLFPSLLSAWVLPHAFGAMLRRAVFHWRVITHAPYQQEGGKRAWRAFGRVVLVYLGIGMVGLISIIMLMRMGGVIIIAPHGSLWETILNYESYPVGGGWYEAASENRSGKIPEEEWPDFEL